MVCPFKGLASFDVEDAGWFFGRERLVAEMVARLVGAPLLASSGRRAAASPQPFGRGCCAHWPTGVLPGSERWALALIRPGEHPVRALGDAAGAATPNGRLVLAVDQFEEVFTACDDESERAAFADALVAAARDPRRRPLVLVAVRADFYDRCAGYPELWRLLAANQVPVGPMRRDELRRAIEQPARRAGLWIDPDLVDALIADVEGEPGGLPLLSTSLLELWQRRDGRRLQFGAYEQSGGVHGAVGRLAESSYARLEPAQRASRGGSCSGWPARARVRQSCDGASGSPSWGPTGDVVAGCWPHSPTIGSLRSAKARSRSRTRRCCASGRGFGRGSKRTRRGAGYTST